MVIINVDSFSFIWPVSAAYSTRIKNGFKTTATSQQCFHHSGYRSEMQSFISAFRQVTWMEWRLIFSNGEEWANISWKWQAW